MGGAVCSTERRQFDSQPFPRLIVDTLSILRTVPPGNIWTISCRSSCKNSIDSGLLAVFSDGACFADNSESAFTSDRCAWFLIVRQCQTKKTLVTAPRKMKM